MSSEEVEHDICRARIVEVVAVTAAGSHHQLRPRDPGGHALGIARWGQLVIGAVDDQRRRGDAVEDVPGVVRAARGQVQPSRVPGRPLIEERLRTDDRMNTE